MWACDFWLRRRRAESARNTPHWCARWLATKRTPSLGTRLRDLKYFAGTGAALRAAASRACEAKRLEYAEGLGPTVILQPADFQVDFEIFGDSDLRSF